MLIECIHVLYGVFETIKIRLLIDINDIRETIVFHIYIIDYL